MLVTGIVEDALAAKVKAKTSRHQKNRDTLTGLRLMELGRATLVGGVWGVLGLRRRILVRLRQCFSYEKMNFVNASIQIYKPYSELTLLNIMRQENEIWPIPSLLFSGLPTVLAYHVSDWVGFVAVDVILDDDEKTDTPIMLWVKRASQIL